MQVYAEIVRYQRRPAPRISVILIDWSVRESFHSLHYLNQQTASRDSYELIWVEAYQNKPAALDEMAHRQMGSTSYLDKWLILNYPADFMFHKHRLYNAGLAAAEGEICVICDSDAVFSETFIESLLTAYTETPNAVVHLDQVRNLSHDFYPFNYPTLDALRGPGCRNWRGTTTIGLDNSRDMLHDANYGACMAARRRDLLAIGGACEHIDYVGYVCGPYELTFRLFNYGRRERWLRNEYLYHTWHPNQSGCNTDYQGPHDGCHVSLRALDARATFRVAPYRKNPWMSQLDGRRGLSANRLQELLSLPVDPAWHISALPTGPNDSVYWVERDYCGFDIFCHADTWYGVPHRTTPLDPELIRKGRYSPLWKAGKQGALRGMLPVNPSAFAETLQQKSLPERLWRQFREQPLHRLPQRLMRTARCLLDTGTAHD